MSDSAKTLRISLNVNNVTQLVALINARNGVRRFEHIRSRSKLLKVIEKMTDDEIYQFSYDVESVCEIIDQLGSLDLQVNATIEDTSE